MPCYVAIPVTYPRRVKYPVLQKLSAPRGIGLLHLAADTMLRLGDLDSCAPCRKSSCRDVVGACEHPLRLKMWSLPRLASISIILSFLRRRSGASMNALLGCPPCLSKPRIADPRVRRPDPSLRHLSLGSLLMSHCPICKQGLRRTIRPCLAITIAFRMSGAR